MKERILKKLFWVQELLSSEFVDQRVPKGIGYYLDEKQVLILIEDAEGSNVHKEISYPFQIWNGCAFPVEKLKQNAVILKFPFLENHPANKNWLYLPQDSEGFEENVETLIRELKKRNPLFGIASKEAATAAKNARNRPMASVEETSRPKMFGDEKSAAKPVAKKFLDKKSNADKKNENEFLLGFLKKGR